MTMGPHTPQFGVALPPRHLELVEMMRAVRYVDGSNIELITVWDHPYRPTEFDTVALLSYLAAVTHTAQLWMKVANLPFRLPPILAKHAATIDVLSGGRFQLGIGTGAEVYPGGFSSFGAPEWKPGESVDHVIEAVQVVRALLESKGAPVNFSGEHYALNDGVLGPLPLRRVPIWIGAVRPRMLKTTGRLADGWTASNHAVPMSKIDESNAIIDDAAAEAGRAPEDIRRGYNMGGVIELGASAAATKDVLALDRHGAAVAGSPMDWAERFATLVLEHRMDTFVFWPMGSDWDRQLRAFAEEVIPAVRDLVRAANPKEH